MEATDAPKKARFRVRALDLGLVATLLFGIFGVYTYLHEKEVGIDFELVSQFDAFSLNTPVSDLKVIFDGQDIQASHQNLRVYSLRVSNSGQVDIVEGMYDSQEDWGIGVTGGRIVACALVESDSDFLRRKLASPSFSADRLTFPKCIIDRRRGFVISVTVLHKRDEIPSLQAFGKVAGIDRLGPIIALPSARDGWIARALGGPLVAHIVRSFVYGGVMLLLLLAVILAQDFWDGRARARRVRHLLQTIMETRGVDAGDPTVQRFAHEYARRGVLMSAELELTVRMPDMSPERTAHFIAVGYAVRNEGRVEIAPQIREVIKAFDEAAERSKLETPKIVA